ncbi:Pre-mRNA-splicing factor ATP-dependent RNA helicase PRP16 [Fasciola hepatica]|uniref:RNA helicase n=1 Tax=Fasciola hepatica TaxID=6192 RepID=A0A4E0R3M3_FASHE|nr:Pre-mRNA-splicing factor ATP-dependent RNA helicase PRP16 [Fasciola hepatica]
MVVELDEAAFRKLEYFSLVSKVCTELTNHLGLDDKNLAEFVIHLAKKNPTFDKFKAALSKKGADFSDALIASILRLVEKMLPKTLKTKKNTKSNSVEADEPNNDTKNEKQELRKKLLPALCLPDEDPAKRRALEEEEDSKMREQDNDGEHAMKFVHPDKESDLKPDIAEFSAVDEAAASDMIKDLEMLLTDAKEKSTLDPKPHRKDTTPMDSKSRSSRRGRRSYSKSPSRTKRSDRADRRRRHSRSHSPHESNSRRRGHRGPSRSPHGRSSRSPSPHSRHRSRDRRASPHEHSPYDSRNSDDRHRRPRNRSRSPDSSSHKPRNNLPIDPVVGEIYQGRVSNILAFGAVVQIEGLRRRCEGLVHISQLRREGRVANVSDVVQRSQKVYVKVLTFTGTRTSLSMREVNQETGEDLNPQNSSPSSRDPADGGKVRNMDDADLDGVRNPDRPTASSTASISRSALFGPRRGDADGVDEDLESGPKRKVQRISSPERWELKQMMSAGVVEKTDLPDFDEETGLLPREDEESDEDIEIELVEEEPPFLKGHGRHAMDLSPVRIVKNPDGSLQQAAMMRQALQKERREIKQQERQSQIMAEREAAPERMGKDWHDPMGGPMDSKTPFSGSRVNEQFKDVPEWKRAVQGGTRTGAVGKKIVRSLLEQRQSLPIYKLKDELLSAVHDNKVLIVIGETGSGKTTQITQYLAEAGYVNTGRIGCTQPRRVAAMSVAKRVSEEFGCRLGQEVGYTIRFEDCTAPETKIKYMTDGMLLRECLIDPDLRQYAIIMLDEAHERTIHTDVLFGLLKKAIQKRDDMKLIVTSATLDSVKFSQYFFEAPIFTIPGRTYPVEILYSLEPENDYLDAALNTVMQIHLTEPPGDILVFLTGQEEIDSGCELLYERMKALGPDVPELIILPVYAALPSEMQSRIFDPAPPGSRKVVIATNIAETSLTIDGVYYVIDPGFVKQKVYSSKSGMDQLIVSPISQAQAKQRAGRAGRTGPGKCFRLYTERAYRDEMLGTNVPEIQRTNLASTVLQLKAMGINDLLSFDFMDPPPLQTLVAAMETLHGLSALDDEGLLTRLGRRMAEFPLEPMLSKMLIMSVHLQCSEEVLTIVSMLSVQNVFYRPKEKTELADQRKAKFHQPEGDHLTLLAVYNAWKNNKFSAPWCYDNFVQARTLKRAQDVRKQLLGIMDRHKLDVVSCGKKTALAQKAILSGFFRNAAKKDPQEGYRTLVDQQVVYIHPSSALFNRQPDWVVYHELVMTTKEYMREVTTIDPRWLVEFAPNFFKFGDPTKLSRAKKSMRIEPLYSKFEEKDSWRISRVPRKFHVKVTF